MSYKTEETTESETRLSLLAGLTNRRSPQSVAKDLEALGVGERLANAGMLTSLARHSSGMPEEFHKHPGLERAYTNAFNSMKAISDTLGLPERSASWSDPESLWVWVSDSEKLLGLDTASFSEPELNKKRRSNYYHSSRPAGVRGAKKGHLDKRTALDARSRRQTLPGVSVRAYRRAVNDVLHLEQRTGVFLKARLKENATMYAKSRLAYLISEDEFMAAPITTVSFVAYYVARLNQRSIFTSGPQDRPMDALADELLMLALNDPDVSPSVIAKVLTRQSVLDLLNEEERGELLALTFKQMQDAAFLLESIFYPKRTNMVVRRGDDSSTWNAASRCYNQARTGWLNLLKALGRESTLLVLCPGKVPALIASDVSFWHASEGGNAHADEAIFFTLPKPWDVLNARAVCGSDVVIAACKANNVDAETSGWTSGYKQSSLEETKASPELVNGVEVSNPELAKLLKSLGAFGGAQ